MNTYKLIQNGGDICQKIFIWIILGLNLIPQKQNDLSSEGFLCEKIFYLLKHSKINHYCSRYNTVRDTTYNLCINKIKQRQNDERPMIVKI